MRFVVAITMLEFGLQMRICWVRNQHRCLWGLQNRLGENNCKEVAMPLMFVFDSVMWVLRVEEC